MSLPRYAAAVDANQAEIVAGLLAHGYSVRYIKEPCDLLVGKGGRNWLLEVKRPKSKGRPAGKKTKAQEKFMDEWRGQYDVVETLEQALEVLKRG